MISAASIKKHPLHPMLIPLPIGLWLFSLFCDVMTLRTGSGVWKSCAFYTMAGGVAGALLAALPGAWDLYRMRPSRAKRIGIWHMCINLTVVTLYAVNLWWRWRFCSWSIRPLELGLSVLAVLLLAVSGWLGGEMVYVHGVAVDPVDEGAQGRKE
ncbi:DUF2231 domain-containing protein [Geomonas sp. RF6]|uniref:DUF2231 domain-containing protein n=1 Tax=Geomonas sp. RF6 TaxID=2897342 RepID=UPI001E49D3D4|nr:DUF2231 domain-containing protein [Geomonas sp. RF6]UFS72132.1 DUF2231 domain-containing protein [Geomonas sp. RF6]